MTQTVLLGDLITIKHGYAFKGQYFSNAPTENILVTPGNFEIGGGFKRGKLKYYNGPIDEAFVLEPGDIIVTMTDLSKAADTLGFSALVPDDNNTYLHNQRIGLVGVKSNVADIEYIYWLMRSPGYRKWIVAGATGSTVKHTAPSKISSYKFNLPDLETQKKIADILGTIDEKIELNRQMNETLEQMGQALFRHYFIDNPEVEKWGKTALGTKIKPRRGKSLQSKNMIPGDVPVVSGGLQPAGLHNQSNTMAPVITVSASGANAGYVALWDKNIWSADSSFIDTTITPHVYFYYLFLSRNQKRIYEMQTGSGQPHIYPSHLELLELPDAPEFLIAEFNNKVAASFEKIEANKQEIQTLTTLRDTLLPRLISGKVKV